MSLKGVVCLVTGATRGIGKGIALQLGQEGATVYITGRTLEAKDDDPIGGSLKETAAEIEARGGKCIAVQCNHAEDEDVDKVFEKIKSEQSGRIDILVNNAFAAVSAVSDNIGKPFWEQPIEMWDTVNNVGLRNHFRCSVHAARMMVPQKHGLIVNISSFGGLTYYVNVAYGVGKEACDRMAADGAKELRKHNVTFVSLWPGPVHTEKVMYLLNNGLTVQGYPKEIFENGESPEYAGKAIANLYKDPKLMSKSGRILLTADLGAEYGFADVDVIIWYQQTMSLKGVVCLVTGATRGIGKGIALQLGQEGATVCITGRTLEAKDGASIGGSLKETAAEIVARDGKCIAVQCNHAKDEDVDKVFEKIKSEQSGRIDILVNNAYAAVSAVFDNIGKPFWEQPIEMWDTVNNVGLRNHFRCSVHAARMMVPQKHGLIVNISSSGGLRYTFSAAYGVGKEACDRMAADGAKELRKHNVAFVSLWPGAVRTEKLMYLLNNNSFNIDFPGSPKEILENGESLEYAGKAIANLYKDPNLMSKSGRILLTADLGAEYGFADVDGRVIPSMCQVKSWFTLNKKTAWMSYFIPGFIRLPKWMLWLGGNKF